MTNIKLALAVGLAAATLALILTNAIAGVMVIQAGLAPVFGIGAIALAIAAFVLSLNQKSFLVAGLLAANGIIFMIPAMMATGYFAFLH